MDKTIRVRFVARHQDLVLAPIRRFLPLLAALSVALSALTGIGWFWLGVLVALLVGALATGGARSAAARVSAGLVEASGGIRIRARDVLAISTARIESGVAIAIENRQLASEGPLLLEVGSDEDAIAIVTALGGGDDGAGNQLRFVGEAGAPWGLLGFAMASVSAIFAGLFRQGMMLSGVLVCSLFFVAGGSLSLARPRKKTAVILTRDGVRLPSGSLLHYASILDATIPFPGELEIALRDGTHHRTRFTGGALTGRHLRAQILTSAARAHGPRVVRASPRDIPVLAPALATSGASLDRGWLAELDAVGRLLRAGGGYRVSAADRGDFEAIVRDADLPSLLRAGAARVLLRAGAPREHLSATLRSLRGVDTAEMALLVAGLTDGPPAELDRALTRLRGVDDSSVENEGAAAAYLDKAL